MTLEQIDEVLNKEEVTVNQAYLDWEIKTAKDSIQYVRDNGLTNLCIACEEIAELQQAITKMIRGKGDKRLVTEELADVYLGMRFVNEVYNVHIGIDSLNLYPFKGDIYSDIKANTSKYSVYEVLRELNHFQNAIFNAIIDKDTSNLETIGNDVLEKLEYLKALYEIDDRDVYKIRNYKMARLFNRIATKTQI